MGRQPRANIRENANPRSRNLLFKKVSQELVSLGHRLLTLWECETREHSLLNDRISYIVMDIKASSIS